jgi:hypothetical protein
VVNSGARCEVGLSERGALRCVLDCFSVYVRCGTLREQAKTSVCLCVAMPRLSITRYRLTSPLVTIASTRRTTTNDTAKMSCTGEYSFVTNVHGNDESKAYVVTTSWVRLVLRVTLHRRSTSGSLRLAEAH